MRHPKSHTDIYGPRERDELPPDFSPVVDAAAAFLEAFNEGEDLEGYVVALRDTIHPEYRATVEKARRWDAVSDLKSAKVDPTDGTEKLCMALYGVVLPEHYLGGSDARMLHDAAEEIGSLRLRIDDLRAQLAEVTRERDEARARIHGALCALGDCDGSEHGAYLTRCIREAKESLGETTND